MKREKHNVIIAGKYIIYKSFINFNFYIKFIYFEITGQNINGLIELQQVFILI
jgi:hypothetical protein